MQYIYIFLTGKILCAKCPSDIRLAGSKVNESFGNNPM
jgi:hypothetical protein